MAKKKNIPETPAVRKIVWTAAEYENAHKSNSWYGVSVIMAVLLVALALWQKNFFFAVFVVIAEASLIILARRRPRIIEFTIDETGVRAGKDVFYPLADMEGFAIVARSGRLDEIIFRRKGVVNPYLRLPIDSSLAKEAKKILAGNLLEIEYEESLLDAIAERLGF